MAVVDAELRTRLKLELDRRARERVRRVRPDFVCATCGIPVDEATPSCRTCARRHKGRRAYWRERQAATRP
jgi:hypothetical protein